jgi:hypothetical protein
MTSFTPDHLRAVAGDYDAAAERRADEAELAEDQGDHAAAAQARTWAANCRITAEDIRTNGLRNPTTTGEN